MNSNKPNLSVPQLTLIEGINNDVIVSTVITGGHLFVQQPVHPSHPGLSVLQRCMNNNYNKCESLPLLDNQIARDVVCAAKVNGHWFRVQIGQREPRTDECVVKFLDYGGYTTVANEDLRQIRADFMTVPFQAIECVLANVRPNEGTGRPFSYLDYFRFRAENNVNVMAAAGKEEQWVMEAAGVLNELTKGKTLLAQVAGYTDDGVPEVLLYCNLAPNVSRKNSLKRI